MNNTDKKTLRAVEVIEPSDNPRKVYAVTVDDVFSVEECQEWIALTESQKYEPALVNIGAGMQQLMTDVRHSDRCIIDSEVMADRLYQRVKHLIPAKFNKDWEIQSLNERLRFLRYYPGHYFKKHQDGNYKRESGPKKGETSFITLQLYLNEVEEGGETKFYYGNKTIGVVPKPGRVLLFQHNLLHEGAIIKKGVKYVMRTDVMYD